jgi:hypothetical protein
VTQSITGSLHTTGCTNHNGDPQGVNQTHQFPGPQFRIALTYDSPNNRYTGRINVEDTSGTGDNNYDDGHWDVIVERCGGSLMYQSDAVDGQTFTLTRSAEDPDVYSYETASSIPVDIRYFETSSDCTGGYLLPLKFGIYLHYDQVAGDRATLTAQAYVGTSIESAKQVYLFRNTVGVAVNSSSFVISNAATGYSCATATADIMTGGHGDRNSELHQQFIVVLFFRFVRRLRRRRLRRTAVRGRQAHRDGGGANVRHGEWRTEYLHGFFMRFMRRPGWDVQRRQGRVS